VAESSKVKKKKRIGEDRGTGTWNEKSTSGSERKIVGREGQDSMTFGGKYSGKEIPISNRKHAEIRYQDASNELGARCGYFDCKSRGNSFYGLSKHLNWLTKLYISTDLDMQQMSYLSYSF